VYQQKIKGDSAMQHSKKRRVIVAIITHLAVFALGVLACYLWGFYILFMALQRACENGMFICG
jgi:hypothetical protein